MAPAWLRPIEIPGTGVWSNPVVSDDDESASSAQRTATTHARANEAGGGCATRTLFEAAPFSIKQWIESGLEPSRPSLPRIDGANPRHFMAVAGAESRALRSGAPVTLAAGFWAGPLFHHASASARAKRPKLTHSHAHTYRHTDRQANQSINPTRHEAAGCQGRGGGGGPRGGRQA